MCLIQEDMKQDKVNKAEAFRVLKEAAATDAIDFVHSSEDRKRETVDITEAFTEV